MCLQKTTAIRQWFFVVRYTVCMYDMKTIGLFTGTVAGVVVLMVGFFWYLTRPAPELTLDELVERRTTEAVVAVEEQRAINERIRESYACGSGISGMACRLKQGTCGTALGSYFCFVEGKEDSTERN